MSRPSSFASSPALNRELAALADGEYAARLGLRAARVAEDNVAVELPFAPSVMNRGGRQATERCVFSVRMSRF
jgi:acyl-coenzyme A thioesterase PaaI-like protein